MMFLLLFLRCVKKGTDDDRDDGNSRGKYLKLMLKEKATIENTLVKMEWQVLLKSLK